MGTTLQGKKIKDTYKSIIKVTDNGEAGSTGKQLSDGNGNDLGIYVDTDGLIGIGAAATVAIDASSKTDAIQVPNGTSDDRPTAGNGMIRYNSTLGKMEYYDGAWKAFAEGDIESVVAGDGLTGGANDGDATVNVVGGTGITVNADDVQISDNGVDHAQLADRYTEDVAISTYTGTVSFDCSNGAVFKIGGDLTGNYTIDLSNYKKGQIITIYPIKGSYTVTLDAQGTSSNTFNKLAESDYDGASSNILQIECVNDSSTAPVFFYSVTTFASASTI